MSERAPWSKTSWRNYPVVQQPKWPDQAEYERAQQEIALMPPLVFAGEIRMLKNMLADAARGQAFLLQGGV